MPELFESLMMVCFGFSWPMSILKAYQSRTAKGKSLFFLVLVTAGYVCGITAKLMAGNLTYVLALYCINLLMLVTELLLYGRNSRLDKERADG